MRTDDQLPAVFGRGGDEGRGGYVLIRVPLLILVNLLAAALSVAGTLGLERYYAGGRSTGDQERAVRHVADQLQRNIGERLAVVEQKVDDLRVDVRELRKEKGQQ